MAVPGVVSYPTTLDDIVSLFGTENRIATTLNGGISDSSTSIVLTSGTGWPNSGTLSIESEIIYYTGKSTNTLTGCLRGRDGTVAAAHSNGVAAQINDTSRHHQVHSEAIIATQTKLGTGSSTPTSGTVLRGTGTGISGWGAIQVSDLPTIPDSKLSTVSTAGKVSDSALSANIPLLNAATQTFTGTGVFNKGTFNTSIGVGVAADTNEYINMHVTAVPTAIENAIDARMTWATAPAFLTQADLQVTLNGGSPPAYVQNIYAQSYINMTGTFPTVSSLTGSIVNNSTATLTDAGAVTGFINNIAGGILTTAKVFSGTLTQGGGTITNASLGKFTLTKTGGTLTTVKGLDLSGWSGSATTSYGIYMDSSIDVGATKYAIYSLSASPSVLSGRLDVPYISITRAANDYSASTDKPFFVNATYNNSGSSPLNGFQLNHPDVAMGSATQFRVTVNPTGTTSGGIVRIMNSQLNHTASGSITQIRGYEAQLISSGTGGGGIWTGFRSTNSVSGGGTITDLRGLSIDTWTNTATVTTSYGIYMDASIDVGVTKWAFYSLSTAPSLFTGVIRAGTTPVTLTDAAGKILSSALNTVAVSQGGTGIASTTPYAVICGGTTSTDSLQQVSGVGTAFQALISNGASALPTWQDISRVGATLQFVGATSSFPMLKRNAATLEVRFADDSAYAQMSVGTLTAVSNIFTNFFDIGTSGGDDFRIDASGAGIKNTGYIRWSSTSASGGTADLELTRSAANILKLGDGASGYGKLQLGASVYDFSGSGSPEGVVTAGVGSVYRRTNGGSATTLYVKESGTGNTGWAAHGGVGTGMTDPMTTIGDIIIRNGSNVTTRLGIGSSGNVLTVTGGVPVWAAPSGGGGITWTEVTGTSQSMAVDNAYIANNGSQVVLTLPTTAAVGKIVRVVGKGAGGWKIAQNASEIIHFGSADTTTGTGGYLESAHRRDAVELVCVVADTEWNVISSQGNITYV